MPIPAQLTVATLGVHDFPAQLAFYKRLGWETAVELEDFACFELRGALLCLFPHDRLAADGNTETAPPQAGMRGFSLAVNVTSAEQVDAAIETARAAGARITKEPVDAAEFEGRSAYFADPEENYWEIVWLAGESRVQAAINRAIG